MDNQNFLAPGPTQAEFDTLNTQVQGLSDHIAQLVKSKNFSLHANATWGTMTIPTDIPLNRILCGYVTGTYSFYHLAMRGDGQMFAWFFNNEGVATILRDVDVTGTIYYLDI